MQTRSLSHAALSPFGSLQAFQLEGRGALHEVSLAEASGTRPANNGELQAPMCDTFGDTSTVDPGKVGQGWPF